MYLVIHTLRKPIKKNNNTKLEKKTKQNKETYRSVIRALAKQKPELCQRIWLEELVAIL